MTRYPRDRAFTHSVIARRRAAGWTQLALADHAGVHVGQVQKLEAGYIGLSPENRSKIEDALHSAERRMERAS